MKNYLLILILLLTGNLIAQNVKKEDLRLVTEKSIYFKNNAAKIKVRLWNKSKDTLNYLCMSCSWQEFYKMSNKNITIRINECDKNIPQILILKPGESRTVEIYVLRSNGTKDDFKLGMSIIQTKELKIPSADYILTEAKVIWSSSIYPKN
ncbi:putative HAD superfamily phosphohydrolase [Flavobacterium sp. CG_23.5]|uniref:hypothetical protein n=1 Tax=unclassified Flavobacterium TaxID=196869 RepID=UPI0018C9DA56|nr:MULTISPECIES: hypothetical protein [unclassified Flavobacterium]MBG6111484.1 putative HAD superfamily phosphohydrolase [Flavobacterium sp. CG_9.10]MBP2282673.1 putative HAD superfamily phosphohydrolase [Flavobacterium sp. CG_23.5]